MLKAQDVLVTLKIACLSDDAAKTTTFALLGDALSMSASQVFVATKRAAACHLLVMTNSTPGAPRFRVVAPNLREFLISGLRYVFPAEPGKPTRGFRTAQDAPPLVSQIVRSPGELPLVSPHPDGDTRGLVVKPLFRSAPEAARRDPRLLEWLTLVDALRIGDARIRTLAAAAVANLAIQVEHARVR